MFSRYIVVATWVTPQGMHVEVIKVWRKSKALNIRGSLLSIGQGYCTVSVIGPYGGLL